ncbi:MAG: nitrate/nitrite transporter NarK [Gammaproteobacteria bacterium]|jgi:nitrate/nitrite transporter NarK
MPRRYLTILSLILAGEAIFSLPFHVARFFRASFLDVFEFSNANLGDVFAVYGITAMIAYFPGGAIADRFSARRLLAVSLFCTAAGGLYMATIPSFLGMSLLFGYWGITTILLFWAAMIRGTREWGGDSSQGRAFGILDGGRGLVAAGLASVAVVVFSRILVDGIDIVDPDSRRTALVNVIYFYTGITFLAGIITWLLVPESPSLQRSQARDSLGKIREVLRQPIIWVQAIIVVSAYCGYKGLDNYSLYAVQVLGMSDVRAAEFTASCAYLRPIAAISAGILADRIGAARLMAALFMILILSFGILSFAEPVSGANLLILSNIFISFAGVYALRAVYFALLGETKIPASMTGTAVGLISLVGFTPDIFFASIGGRLLDNAPGITGHHHYFLLLTGIMLIGLIATLILVWLNRSKRAIDA